MTRLTDLASVAGAYRDALRARGALQEFELTPYDRTGIPVVATVVDQPGGDAHGVGYGASLDAATVGALGEVAERVLLQDALRTAPVERGSFTELTNRFGTAAVADPVSLIVDADSGYAPDRPLHWMPARRWRTGETVWIPAEFAAFDGGSLPAGAERDGLITPITNGMGAGDTLERAVGHGLLELVQRDGDNVVFRALDQGTVVDLSASTHPGTRAALDALRSAGIEPIVKLASTEFACVVYCAGSDDDPSALPVMLSAIGEAADPDRDAAVAKALLEFASSRARRAFAFGPFETVRQLSPDYYAAELRRPVGAQEQRALDTMREWSAWDAATMRARLEPIFHRARTVALDTLPQSPPLSPAEQLSAMLDRLADFDVLVVAAPPAGGMHAAKVLAPGLEVETLSYLRAGERAARALLNQDGGLVGRGPADPAAGRHPIRLSDAARDRLGGPLWLDAGAVERVVGGLYPLYREPRRHAADRIRR